MARIASQIAPLGSTAADRRERTTDACHIIGSEYFAPGRPKKEMKSKALGEAEQQQGLEKYGLFIGLGYIQLHVLVLGISRSLNPYTSIRVPLHPFSTLPFCRMGAPFYLIAW